MPPRASGTCVALRIRRMRGAHAGRWRRVLSDCIGSLLGVRRSGGWLGAEHESMRRQCTVRCLLRLPSGQRGRRERRRRSGCRDADVPVAATHPEPVVLLRGRDVQLSATQRRCVLRGDLDVQRRYLAVRRQSLPGVFRLPSVGAPERRRLHGPLRRLHLSRSRRQLQPLVVHLLPERAELLRGGQQLRRTGRGRRRLAASEIAVNFRRARPSGASQRACDGGRRGR